MRRLRCILQEIKRKSYAAHGERLTGIRTFTVRRGHGEAPARKQAETMLDFCQHTYLVISMSAVAQLRTVVRTFRVEQIGQASEEPEPPRVLTAYLCSILIKLPGGHSILIPYRPSGESSGKREDGSAHAELVHCFQADFGRPW